MVAKVTIDTDRWKVCRQRKRLLTPTMISYVSSYDQRLAHVMVVLCFIALIMKEEQEMVERKFNSFEEF